MSIKSLRFTQSTDEFFFTASNQIVKDLRSRHRNELQFRHDLSDHRLKPVIDQCRNVEFPVVQHGGDAVGQFLRVGVFDPRESRGRRSAAGASGPQAIASPMPGRVIRVLVEPGQEVAAGEGVIVVEAMKMQNEMKAPRAGRVAAVKTAAGATVSAGDVMLVIE